MGRITRNLDEQGRLSSVRYPSGNTSGYGYDANGNIEYYTNAVGVVKYYIYDPAGKIAAVTNLTTGSGGGSVYDAAGRLVVASDALGNRTGYSYNPDDSIAAMTNALGNVWTYSYDRAASCCGGENTAALETDPLGRQKQKILSPHGLPLQMIYRSGPNATTNAMTYWTKGDSPDGEPENYLQTVTDEGGNTRHFGYTDFGKVARASDLSGGIFWTNHHDESTGLLTNLVSPTGEQVIFTYDDDEFPKTIRFADGHYLTNFYNALNLLSSNTLPSGEAVSYFYDEAQRLTNWTSTIGEAFSYEYNNLDQLVVAKDGLGISVTTNLYDAAGRLYGIDHGNGASLRYAYDSLGRITNFISKAGVAGPSYTNSYAYDPIGNLTNITVQLNNQTYQTSFQFDRVNRKTRRILPNGIVTTYQYDWRDRLTNVIHRTADGLVLASVAYERTGLGQPTKITRENGTYVLLAYDSSLRLTNEVFFNSLQVPQATNSYGYDAAGSRTYLRNSSGTYTNVVQSGYQVTHITNAGNNTLSDLHIYDAGGRMTTISNASRQLKLRYNTKDQVTAVTNGSANSVYSYDAGGRRVQASDSNGTVLRRFVMASTGDNSLDSPVLVADGSGNVQQGYVYAGDVPLFRFDSSGNVTYYLEDAMGSVIGLAPNSDPSTSTTTRLFYDGFGKTRETNGPAPVISASVGGDFRFQGVWLESATELYHMRARDYDCRSGRFLSRDPGQGDFRTPESLHPYAFALNNPYIYIDPSGEFSMVEISLVGAIDFILATLKTVAVAEAKSRAVGTLTDFMTTVVMNELPLFGIPIEYTKIQKWMGGRDAKELGNLAELAIWEAMCWVLRNTAGGEEWPKYMHHGVRVVNSKALDPKDVGRPVSRGRNCIEPNPFAGWGLTKGRPYSLPDLIFGVDPPLKPLGTGSKGDWNRTQLDGEVKLRATTLLADYFIPGRNKEQLHAILAYAGRHTEWRTSIFFVGIEDKGLKFVNKKVENISRGTVFVNGLRRGVLSLYVPVKKLPAPK